MSLSRKCALMFTGHPSRNKYCEAVEEETDTQITVDQHPFDMNQQQVFTVFQPTYPSCLQKRLVSLRPLLEGVFFVGPTQCQASCGWSMLCRLDCFGFDASTKNTESYRVQSE